MSRKDHKSLADESMLDLFRLEVEQQSAVLMEGLMRLEQGAPSSGSIEPLMRAAHSIKGAARLVGIMDAVGLAHELEDCLVAAQKGRLTLSPDDIDLLLKSVDMRASIASLTRDGEASLSVAQKAECSGLEASLGLMLNSDGKAKKEKKPSKAEVAPTIAEAEPRAKEEIVAPVQASARPAATPPASRSAKKTGDATLKIGSDLSDPTMLELFRLEVEQHGQVLTDGLLRLEEDPGAPERIEPLMRAAHSIKGAARLVGIHIAVDIAHRLVVCLVAAQTGKLSLDAEDIDVLQKGNDLLSAIAQLTENVDAVFSAEQQVAYDHLLDALADVLAGRKPAKMSVIAAAPATAPHNDVGEEAEPAAAMEPKPSEGVPQPRIVGPKPKEKATAPHGDRVLRISAEQLNRLMGLAGESMVEARWLRPYAESMLRLKRRQAEMITLLDGLREELDERRLDRDSFRRLLRETQGKAAECRQILADRLAELEAYDRRAVNLSSRLRREVVTSRMRPFGDGVQGFPRMVRDLARQLGKQAQLQIDGQATMGDRDILEKIEAPLNHLLRNALDHGLEALEERVSAGKPERGTIRLAAYHQSGMLSVVVEDDGRGVDIERLRRKVVERKLVTEEMAVNLSEAELMEFLFLPSFSTKEQVTEISGRGVGLDVVHDVVQEMRGMVRATSQFGTGTRFQLQLPLTLSVLPALIAEIAGEPKTKPHAHNERIMHVDKSTIREVEGHQYVSIEGHHVGLVSNKQEHGINDSDPQREQLPVVVLGERKNSYGLVVDKFLGERDLVVHVLLLFFGLFLFFFSVALLVFGVLLLVVDVDDMLRSIEKIVSVGRLNRVGHKKEDSAAIKKKRILVVDDSITVREVERKLLETSGYEVEVAVDGMDGWNALRESEFELVITDIDMPRMDGIELVRMIRQDTKYQALPVMIVSYKDREEDRYRGLEAGADYYLTKGSFHDETLREAVMVLIGVAA